MEIFQGIVLDNGPYDKEVADDDHDDHDESNDEQNDCLACRVIGVMLELGLNYHPHQFWNNSNLKVIVIVKKRLRMQFFGETFSHINPYKPMKSSLIFVLEYFALDFRTFFCYKMRLWSSSILFSLGSYVHKCPAKRFCRVW